MSENVNDILFGNLEANDETMSVFDKKTTQTDGIYRPLLKDAKDKNIGYRATLRFLPNILENGTIGPSAFVKHVHYVDMKNEPNLSGYYECNKNHESECPICTEYWKLKNSKNAAENEKAEILSRTSKYYSYVLVIEDEQHKDLVGKILIYPYGFTIKEKINSERQGEISGNSCNVFNLAKGKDFRLIIKEKGGFANYEASQFMDVSPIKIYNEKTEKFLPAPLTPNGQIGIDGDPAKTASIQKKITEMLSTKEVLLSSYEAVKWDEKMRGKVDSLLSYFSGNMMYKASQQASKAGKDMNNDKIDDFDPESTEADDFFNIEE